MDLKNAEDFKAGDKFAEPDTGETRLIHSIVETRAAAPGSGTVLEFRHRCEDDSNGITGVYECFNPWDELEPR